ncbi:MAG: dihydroneopterin aldolase [Lentisphaeria bacterium]|nr:dihydroneopterin aldolase [Lentisphaeria bacterium]
MDQISIVNLRCTSHIGCKEKERELPQALLVTATVFLDTREAAATDDLEKTVNYSQLSKKLIRRCEESTCKLIETLAQTLVQECLDASERVQKATVEIRKPAGLPNGDYAALTITRERGH